ncbi:leucine-rich repeat domain-containing protein [Myroides profundi]|uniref:Uncharacterized protein n=1 Tax=Myroides profundi TaxID=480520 RepID=A0AAJ4W466_MYRPR|nr:leucine-rich repeat domain-containing protein [Myroides profundi]AJH14528.1 hypothetical protein MPR_1346 [Myroides profundi]SEQ93708.1 hypothetical protein SAMN04488089_107162 [Myroides profundi]
MKNLIITPSELLNIELNSLDDNTDYLDHLLESKFFEYNYPLGQISLYDSDKTQVLLEHTTQEKINQYLKGKKLESLKITSLYPDQNLPYDIDSIDLLILHGNSLNTCALDKKHQFYSLANQIKNVLPLSNFIENINERIELENNLFKLYDKVLDFKQDFISDDLIEFIRNKNIKQLEIGWFFLSENDYNKIASLDLEVFCLQYSFTKQIKILPKQITDLVVLGNSIKSLNEIHYKKLKLSNIDFSGNSISDLIKLSDFNKILETLALANNLITQVDFTNTNKSLNLLDLSVNQITNEGLIIPEPCNNITFLDLRYNKIKVNLDFLFKIDKYFPNLEYIDLTGNEFTNAFTKGVLGSMIDENQIQAIKDYLDLIEFNESLCFQDIEKQINNYNRHCYLKLEWTILNSSTQLLIKELQFYLDNYLKQLSEDERYFFAEGVYINLYHKNISIVLNSTKDTITLEIYSSDLAMTKDYFYKYLELMHFVVFDVTHQYLLPTLQTSNNISDLADFFKKVYRIDAKLKQKKTAGYLVELDNKTNRYTLLVNQTQDYNDTRVDIDRVMFAIVSSKSVIVYTLSDNNTISNYILDKKDKRLNSLTLRKADDKEKYKTTLLNPYLSHKPFQDIDAYVDGEIKKKFNLIINPLYIYQDQDQPGVLYLNTDNYKVDPNNKKTEHSSEIKIQKAELLFVSKSND